MLLPRGENIHWYYKGREKVDDMLLLYAYIAGRQGIGLCICCLSMFLCFFSFHEKGESMFFFPLKEKGKKSRVEEYGNIILHLHIRHLPLSYSLWIL